MRFPGLVAGGFLDWSSFSFCRQSLHDGQVITLNVSNLWMCGSHLPGVQKNRQHSCLYTRAYLHSRHLFYRTHHRSLFKTPSYVSMGLQRNAFSLQRRHSSRLHSCLVFHRALFRKNSQKIFLKNHCIYYIMMGKDFMKKLS